MPAKLRSHDSEVSVSPKKLADVRRDLDDDEECNAWLLSLQKGELENLEEAQAAFSHFEEFIPPSTIPELVINSIVEQYKVAADPNLKYFLLRVLYFLTGYKAYTEVMIAAGLFENFLTEPDNPLDLIHRLKITSDCICNMPEEMLSGCVTELVGIIPYVTTVEILQDFLRCCYCLVTKDPEAFPALVPVLVDMLGTQQLDNQCMYFLYGTLVRACDTGFEKIVMKFAVPEILGTKEEIFGKITDIQTFCVFVHLLVLLLDNGLNSFGVTCDDFYARIREDGLPENVLTSCLWILQKLIETENASVALLTEQFDYFVAMYNDGAWAVRIEVSELLLTALHLAPPELALRVFIANPEIIVSFTDLERDDSSTESSTLVLLWNLLSAAEGFGEEAKGSYVEALVRAELADIQDMFPREENEQNATILEKLCELLP